MGVFVYFNKQRINQPVVTRGYFKALKGKHIAVVINQLRTFPLVGGNALCHMNTLEEKLKAELVWVEYGFFEINLTVFYANVFASFKMTTEKLMSIMSIGNVHTEKSTLLC